MAIHLLLRTRSEIEQELGTVALVTIDLTENGDGGSDVRNASLLARALTLLALGCALAVWAWPESDRSDGVGRIDHFLGIGEMVCRACGSDILRTHATNGGRR